MENKNILKTIRRTAKWLTIILGVMILFVLLGHADIEVSSHGNLNTEDVQSLTEGYLLWLGPLCATSAVVWIASAMAQSLGDRMRNRTR